MKKLSKRQTSLQAVSKRFFDLPLEEKLLHSGHLAQSTAEARCSLRFRGHWLERLQRVRQWTELFVGIKAARAEGDLLLR